jgi:hypothetical protein
MQTLMNISFLPSLRDSASIEQKLSTESTFLQSLKHFKLTLRGRASKHLAKTKPGGLHSRDLLRWRFSLVLRSTFFKCRDYPY